MSVISTCGHAVFEVGDVGAFDGFADEQLIKEAAWLARSLGLAGPRLVEDDNKKPY
jgi:hypothetical protein